MPRIQPLQPPYPPQLAEQFDRIMPPGMEPLQLFRTLGRSERHWTKFIAGQLLDRGPLRVRERELIIDRTCARCGCEYEWGVHVAVFGAKAALTDEQVRALANAPADAPCWSKREQVILASVDALLDRRRWTDEEFTRAREVLTEPEVFELIALVGYYQSVSLFAGALALPLEPFAARFPER